MRPGARHAGRRTTAGRGERARKALPVRTPHWRRLALDRQALDRFLAGVERRALRTAEIATGNREDALDVVQEAMLTLARRYADLGPEDWRRLFNQVLQSKIMDWHRRNAVRSRWRVWFRRAEEDADDPLENHPGRAQDGPDRRLEGERMTGTLERALGALPMRQQQAFLLRTWEGLGVAETAAAMGCSAGSVKTHYSRAVRALRARLEEHR